MIRIAVLYLSLLVLLAGCGAPSTDPRPAERPAPDKVSGSALQPQYPITVIDGLGRELKLPASPRRIVSVAPKNTEMLFALGAEAQLVGVTSYCTYPAAATRLSQVGGFSSKSLSLERIVSLQPDLVIAAGEVHAPTIAELERLHLPVLALAGDTLQGLCSDLKLLGQVTGHESEAAALVDSMNQRLNNIRQRAAAIPAAERVTAVYVVWADPLSVASPDSFLGELLVACGCENVIADSSTRFPKISLETLVQRNPQVIVSSTNHAGLLAVDALRTRPGWSDVAAVEQGRVILIDGDLVSRCGPRMIDAMEVLFTQLYPAGEPK